MTEDTERDQLATRRRILEEYRKVQAQVATNPSVWRYVTFRAHKRLSDTIGEDFCDYPEFEFWFSRFARGDFDLDYDRSSDPKSRSFTDLPVEIFEKVGEYLKLEDRIQLRNVSKDIRAHVDNWDSKVTKVYYSSANSWNLEIRSKPYGAYYTAQNVIGYPISFVMSVLKHPKLQLEKMRIDLQGVMWKKVVKRLDASNRKLHVKHVEFQNRKRRAKIDLHFMVPGVLEEIKMFLVDPTHEDITEIVKSEQCQAAKLVYIESPIIFSQFPSDVLYKCPRFTLKLGGRPAYGLKAKFLKKLMEKGEVQKCVLYISTYRFPENRSQIMKYFNEPEAMVPNFPSLRRYPIEGTNDFYELEYRENAVRLERKHKTHEMVVAIRGRILEEYRKVETKIATNPELWRKLSFEGHKELCKVLDFVDYPEFEFWFSRFARGDFDWDYDRSTEPKARSLTELPFDIFEKISGNLELHDRLQLRDVCKDFRARVDNWDPKVTEIYYRNVDGWRIWQTSRHEPYSADNFGQNENNIFSSCPYRKPISFVMNILKHPKLRLEKLTIRGQDKYWNTLINKLDESNRKVHVKNVEFPDRHLQSKLNLHYMIPGVLEEIKIYLANPNHREIIEMIKSEQCQSAKMVYIDSPTHTSEFPLDVLYNCPRFTLRLGGRPADGLKAIFLKTLRKKGEVQKCVLYAESQFMEYFNEPEAMVPDFPLFRRYPIPETNEFYELEYRKEFVCLQKKQ